MIFTKGVLFVEEESLFVVTNQHLKRLETIGTKTEFYVSQLVQNEFQDEDIHPVQMAYLVNRVLQNLDKNTSDHIVKWKQDLDKLNKALE